MSADTVFVKILDKEYQVACPREEREALLDAANNLDECMREIRASGSVIGLERIAVMAALNLSHEVLQANPKPKTDDEEALRRLTDRVDQALHKYS
jgi:cell division protein ZapA